VNDRSRISDLRFRFGTRDLKPLQIWSCPEECVTECDHDGASLKLEAEDGEHITLVLEHADVV